MKGRKIHEAFVIYSLSKKNLYQFHKMPFSKAYFAFGYFNKIFLAIYCITKYNLLTRIPANGFYFF